MTFDPGSLRSNAAYRACVEELEKYRIHHTVEMGGKHPKIVFTFRGVEMKKPIPGTAGDKIRGPLKARADIRRMIHEAERRAPKIAPERASVSKAEPAPAPSRSHQMRDRTMEDTTRSAGNERLPMEAQRNPIVRLVEGEALADSRDVAAYFDKRHDNVVQAYRNLQCSDHFRRLNFQAFKTNDLTGETTSHVLMTKDGFVFLVMGFTGGKAARFKEAYIAQFNAMESELRRPQKPDETIDRMFGIEKATIHKVTVIEKAVETMAASMQLMMEAVARISDRLDHRAIDAFTSGPVADTGMVTAYEVVGFAEVRPDRRYPGLYAWVSKEIQKHCGRNCYRSRLVNLMPGERWEFQREAAIEWLQAGGRADIWRRIQAYEDRKRGQGVINFPKGRGEPASPTA